MYKSIAAVALIGMNLKMQLFREGFIIHDLQLKHIMLIKALQLKTLKVKNNLDKPH